MVEQLQIAPFCRQTCVSVSPPELSGTRYTRHFLASFYSARLTCDFGDQVGSGY